MARINYVVRDMARRICLEWPSTDLRVKASLLEDEEPELCDLLWERLNEPVKFFCRHPVSTGEEFSAEARPPRHPVKTGEALGRHRRMFCEIPPGSINYSVFGGYGGISCYYGPCTEAITVKGAVVAKVDDGDMPTLRAAGKTVWNAYYMTHVPITMTARRCQE